MLENIIVSVVRLRRSAECILAQRPDKPRNSSELQPRRSQEAIWALKVPCWQIQVRFERLPQSAGGPKPCGMHACYGPTPAQCLFEMMHWRLRRRTAQEGQLARSVGSPAVLVACRRTAMSKSMEVTCNNMVWVGTEQDRHVDHVESKRENSVVLRPTTNGNCAFQEARVLNICTWFRSDAPRTHLLTLENKGANIELTCKSESRSTTVEAARKSKLRVAQEGEQPLSLQRLCGDDRGCISLTS